MDGCHSSLHRLLNDEARIVSVASALCIEYLDSYEKCLSYLVKFASTAYCLVTNEQLNVVEFKKTSVDDYIV
jgi:hypothetical protein